MWGKWAFLIVLVMFASCETPYIEESEDNKDNTLFFTNNSVDGELESVVGKYTRRGTGNGLVGDWTYEYLGTTDGEVTGRVLYEFTFTEEGKYSSTITTLRRRVIEYVNFEPVFGWEYVGLPITASGSFEIESVEKQKIINMKKYNFNDGSYIMIYENTNIYVSEHYLYIGNLNEAIP
jgi:hypothetical protein